jgi:hypothetical protein
MAAAGNDGAGGAGSVGAPADEAGEDEEEGADKVEREQALLTQRGLRVPLSLYSFKSYIQSESTTMPDRAWDRPVVHFWRPRIRH